jgi:hypothetical protein
MSGLGLFWHGATKNADIVGNTLEKGVVQGFQNFLLWCFVWPSRDASPFFGGFFEAAKSSKTSLPFAPIRFHFRTQDVIAMPQNILFTGER